MVQVRQAGESISSGDPKHLNRILFDEVEHALNVCGLSPCWDPLNLDIPDVCNFFHVSRVFVVTKSRKLPSHPVSLLFCLVVSEDT